MADSRRPLPRLRRAGVILVLLPLLLLTGARAGEDADGQPYTKVRYPSYKDGRLESLLEADTADVFDLTAGAPRIQMENVIITLFDHSGAEDLPLDRPPPVKMRITSDRGFFMRKPPEPGADPEEIANLEGNVVARRFRTAKAGEAAPPRPPAGHRGPPPDVETEIHCEHAQWNNTLRKLNGEGEVEFQQGDSVITGTGFLYLADDEAMESGSSSENIKDWGGIIFIEHNARMEIRRRGADSAGTPEDLTVITCRDTASYKLREREIQFERDVRVRRRDLLIESDILKVFLRQDEETTADPRPVGEGGALMPGQVKSIVATIGKRPGSVVITGYEVDERTGTDEVQYVAKGGRADFDFDTNRITLTDTREQRWPTVEFGDGGDRISDGTLIFEFAEAEVRRGPAAPAGTRRETILDSLATSGGRGEVVLRSRGGDAEAGPALPTVVDYRGDMSYVRVYDREDGRKEGRILFREKVNLRRGPLNILAELLDIRLGEGGDIKSLNRIRRIIAEEEVDIRTEEYQAKAERAEYDVHVGVAGPPGSNLDTLRLFGPPQMTPPHPWIRDADGNYISAPEIHMQRLAPGVAGQRDQHLMVARGGSSTCEFLTRVGEDPADAGKVVTIKCERGMEYNQALKKARFEGEVMAASDAPEDNYVLTSDRLLVDFEESRNPDKPEELVTWIRRITAEGNARLMQDTRVCEAINIIRDFPINDVRGGDIYLQGAPAQSGRPPVLAVYREQLGPNQIGSMFASPLIKSSSRGDLIQANGPGELSMPDEGAETNPNLRAQIRFEGAASYKAQQGGEVSDANFWGGVVLSQPSRNVYITSDELDARFMRDDRPDSFGGHADEVELEHIGRLRRAEGRGNVRIEHGTAKGHSVAVGDVGVVEFTGSGNIIRLSADRRADPRRFVFARYHDGKTIRAPEIEVREAQGITRASGPGDLELPADRREQSEGLSEAPTRVLYGERGSMVYNELALNIRVTNNVRIVQPGVGDNWSFPSLDGICDRLEISLFEPPAAGMTGDDTLARVSRMDAIGGVVLRVYADPPPENPNMNWLMRPGTTFFTRGDQAVYDVPKGEISIFCLDNRQPQLLLNIVESGRAPVRQRMKADRFVLQTNVRPRKYNFHGNLETTTLREGEPFDFSGN